MRFWIQILILSASGLSVVSQTCPSDHFSAAFIATADDPFLRVVDTELTYFKTVMKFNEDEIQHVTDDAIHFFKSIKNISLKCCRM